MTSIDFTSPEAREEMRQQRLKIAATAWEADGYKLNPVYLADPGRGRKHYGTAAWRAEFTDQDLIHWFKQSPYPNPDRPTVEALTQFRERLPYPMSEQTCLHWIRNRVVSLRKEGLLKEEN